jgi:hypothetical protein
LKAGFNVLKAGFNVLKEGFNALNNGLEFLQFVLGQALLFDQLAVG